MERSRTAGISTGWLEAGLRVPGLCQPEQNSSTSSSGGGPILFGSVESGVWPWEMENNFDISEWHNRPETLFEIEVAAFYEEGYGFTCAVLETSEGEMYMQNQVHGAGSKDCEPEFMNEVALLLALQLANEKILKNGKKDEMHRRAIRIRAGPPALCTRMGKWLVDGRCRLVSAAASGILQECGRLAEIAPRPVIMMPGKPQFMYKKDGPKGGKNDCHRCSGGVQKTTVENNKTGV